MKKFYSNKHKLLSLLVASVSFAVPLTAQAIETTNITENAPVSYGCAVPQSGVKHVFYVDPVKGSMTGDGSSAHPWHTLQEVWQAGLIASPHYAVNPPTATTKLAAVSKNAVVMPGDVVMLRTGNHGVFHTYGAVNSDFITIMAEPGQSPVLTHIQMQGAQKWILRGLNVTNPDKSTVNGSTALVDIGGGSFGATSDVIIESNNVSNGLDAMTWTATDWINRMTAAAIYTRAPCTAIYNNYIHNVRSAIGVAKADDIYIQGNQVRNFGDDGIDFSGNRITISYNTIGDHHSILADLLHPDCMQGQSLPGLPMYKDIFIIGNYCARRINNALPEVAGDYMQGIDTFDGAWSNWTVIKNTVITNTWHGITLFGVNNALIENNTVLGTDPTISTWIDMEKAKADSGGMAPVNNVIRNNIANRFTAYGPGTAYGLGVQPGVVFDHNMTTNLPNAKFDVDTTTSNTVGPTTKYPQMLGAKLKAVFVQFDNVNMLYDDHLTPDSPARKQGVETIIAAPNAAPGVRIHMLTDLGAYDH